MHETTLELHEAALRPDDRNTIRVQWRSLDHSHGLPLSVAEPQVEANGHGDDVRGREQRHRVDAAPGPDHHERRHHHDRPGQREREQRHEPGVTCPAQSK